MPRINAVDPAQATGTTKEMLDAVNAKFGMIPNLMRTVAQSPAALEGYLNLNGALAKGSLRPVLRQQLALTIAEENGCNYCLSAHTAIGKGLKMDDATLLSARHGNATDSKVEAALRFADAIVENRGNISDEQFAEVRAAGYTDGEIVEIVAHVALNIFTNYFNTVAQTAIDFPLVTAAAK